MPKFRNDGGQQFVVELGHDVHKGDEFEGSDALAAVHGFVLIDEPKKAAKAKDEE